MNEEKALAFLDLKRGKPIDKFIMKLSFWFDFGFTALIVPFGLLLQVFRLNLFDYLFFAGCVLTIVCFAIWYMKAVNPTTEISYTAIVLFSAAVKLLYGYFCYSNYEAIEYQNPRFSWFHLIVMVTCLFIAFYMCLRFYHILRDLKTHTIEQARKNIIKKQKGSLWISVICSPMILILMVGYSRSEKKVGMGFCLWSLFCFMMCLFSMLIPKIIVMKKYKIADVLSKDKDNGSMS